MPFSPTFSNCRDSLNFEGTPIKIIYRGKALRDVGRAARKGEATGKSKLFGDDLDTLSTTARKNNVDRKGGESVSRGKKVAKKEF